MHIKTDCNEGGAVQCRCCENCSKFDRWDSNQKATWNKLKTISGDQLLDVNSPQYKAAHWIIEDDKWHYPSNSPFVFQRYVLIILYEMMGEESWFKPDPHSDECKWARVGCNHAGFIEHIELGETFTNVYFFYVLIIFSSHLKLKKCYPYKKRWMLYGRQDSC